MAKVWVQVWTAQVPGSVQVEEAQLRKVMDYQKMIPMLVKVEESGWQMAQPPVTVTVEGGVLSKYQELAVSKGWGWVLGLEGHHHKSD